MSASQVKNEIYEPKKLDAIYQNILVSVSNDRQQDYEIRVDDFPVIGKNSDPERFMRYAEFITPETRYVSVLLYKSNGQSDKYFFHLQPNTFQKADQLRGIETVKQNTIDEIDIKDKMRKELHYEDLLKENAAYKKEIEEYELIFKQMEDKMERMKSNRDMNIEGIGSLLFSGIMKSDFVKEKFPIVGDLAGTHSTNPNTEEQASYKRKGTQDVQEEEESTQDISDREKGYLLFIDDIRNRIGDIELANVMHLLDLMATNPLSVHFAIKQVTNFLKQKEKETNSSDEKI